MTKGEALRNIRLALHMSPVQLADRLEVPPLLVSKFEQDTVYSPQLFPLVFLVPTTLGREEEVRLLLRGHKVPISTHMESLGISAFDFRARASAYRLGDGEEIVFMAFFNALVPARDMDVAAAEFLKAKTAMVQAVLEQLPFPTLDFGHAHPADFEAAAEVARWILSFSPMDLEGLYLRGRAYAGAGKYRLAILDFSDYLERAVDVEVHSLRAICRIASAEYQRALFDLDEVAVDAAQDHLLYELRATARMHVGDFDGARQDFLAMAECRRRDAIVVAKLDFRDYGQRQGHRTAVADAVAAVVEKHDESVLAFADRAHRDFHRQTASVASISHNLAYALTHLSRALPYGGELESGLQELRAPLPVDWNSHVAAGVVWPIPRATARSGPIAEVLTSCDDLLSEVNEVWGKFASPMIEQLQKMDADAETLAHRAQMVAAASPGPLTPLPLDPQGSAAIAMYLRRLALSVESLGGAHGHGVASNAPPEPTSPGAEESDIDKELRDWL
jgi:tetratricopeptide (TPR) repeat protein